MVGTERDGQGRRSHPNLSFDPENMPISLHASIASADSRKELTMNRLLWIASAAIFLTGTTGCLHHNTRSGCKNGNCNTGACANGNCGKPAGGMLARHGGGCKSCGQGSGRNGCQAGPLGWQQGGHNYSDHLGPKYPGNFGSGAIAQHLAPGHAAAQQLQSQPFNPGPPTGTVAYPYYTHRGPRDFLLDNPPSIGR